MTAPRRNRVTVLMEDQLLDIIEEYARQERRSKSDLIRIVLWEFVNHQMKVDMLEGDE